MKMTNQERYEEIQKDLQELYVRSAKARSHLVIQEYEARISYLENLASMILR